MPSFKRPSSAIRQPDSAPQPREPKEAPKPLEKADLAAELSIDARYINEEVIGQALLMRKYTKELSMLRKKTKSIENKLELKEAQLRATFSNNGRGLKVAEVDGLIVQDAEVQKLRIELYDAEEERDAYEGIVKSVSQRMEMLKELCANLRKEMVL